MSVWVGIKITAAWVVLGAIAWAIVHGGSKLNPHDSDDWPDGGAA